MFYNPQWDRLVGIPELSQNIKAEVRRVTGLELTEWHTGGGCMALGVALPDNRELLIVDGDANLPGRYDAEVYAVFSSREGWDESDPEYHAETGDADALENLIDFIRTHI